MNTKKVNVGVAVLLCTLMAALAGGIGYWLRKPKVLEAAPATEIVVTNPLPTASPAAAEPEMTDADWQDLIAEIEVPPTPAAPNFNAEDMAARRDRWESMSVEQRQMLRKAMFSALAKVDGLEEIGDAIREGKIDPRKFNLDPTAIADRLEFHADTMDQEAMEKEVTKALQEVVDQARTQMK